MPCFVCMYSYEYGYGVRVTLYVCMDLPIKWGMDLPSSGRRNLTVPAYLRSSSSSVFVVVAGMCRGTYIRSVMYN